MPNGGDTWKIKRVALIRLVSKIILASVPKATQFQMRLKIDDTHKKFANLDDKINNNKKYIYTFVKIMQAMCVCEIPH